MKNTIKNVFISMPMREKSREEISREQEKLLRAVGEHLKENVTHIKNYLNENARPLSCLGENLKRMAEADYVLFAEGFENARGCRIEHAAAKEYGKKILLEHGENIQEEI